MFGQRHGEHGDVHPVRGGVLVELLELQQGDHDLLPGVHRDRERPDDRFGLGQGEDAAGLDLLLEPADRIRLLAQRVGDRRGGDRRLLRLAAHADRAEADARGPHLARLRRIDRGQGQAGQHLVQKALELVAPHALLELEPLDARLSEPVRPVP